MNLAKNVIKKKYGTERAVLEAPKRIEWVALDLVEHYREKIMPNEDSKKLFLIDFLSF